MTPGGLASPASHSTAGARCREGFDLSFRLPPSARERVHPGHCNDRRRSFRLADLAPLADVPGVSLVSLQRGFGTDQIADAGFPIVDLGPEFAGADMLDVAGVMTHLDLVVAAVTGLAHLAGATGRPTWLAMSHAVKWRWMLGREDSPWYPTMRLFRQERLGECRGVLRRMAQEVRRMA